MRIHARMRVHESCAVAEICFAVLNATAQLSCTLILAQLRLKLHRIHECWQGIKNVIYLDCVTGNYFALSPPSDSGLTLLNLFKRI